MKKIFLLAGLTFVLASFAFQGDADLIVGAFKSGKAEEVSKYLDDYVDIKLLDKAEVKNIGHKQAGLTLKAFFEENGINGFEKASDRAIGNTMYITGKLLNNGKNFGITLLLKMKEGKYQIITLRIN